MQVGFTEKDKQILVSASKSTGGTIAELRVYDRFARLMKLDDVDDEKEDASDEPEIYEMKQSDAGMLLSIINRSTSWVFSQHARVLALVDRLEKVSKGE